jgi:hypothetical protein
MNLGDGSPIEHLERAFSISGGLDDTPFPANRKSFYASLGSNVSSTFKALFYGVIAMATAVGGFPGLGAVIPSSDVATEVVGKLPMLAAVLLTVAPLVARLNQISLMEPALRNPQQVSYFRAKALVGTLLDVGMGGLIFAIASLSGFDVAITSGVLTGWAGAKLSSGGAHSPLELLEQFMASAFGEDTAAPVAAVPAASVHAKAAEEEDDENLESENVNAAESSEDEPWPEERHSNGVVRRSGRGNK